MGKKIRSILLVLAALSLISGALAVNAANTPPPGLSSPTHDDDYQPGLTYIAPVSSRDDSRVVMQPAARVPWSRVVFQSYRGQGNWEIYTANDDGSGEARVTDNIANDIYPRFNWGATRIAFSSNRTGNYELYVMNADGVGLTRLTENPANDYRPAWSPDGSRIAFDSYRDGQYEIYVMNADGSGLARLTADAAADIEPAWSPDGSRIAFCSTRNGTSSVWVMNADGSAPVLLAAQAYAANPAWSPDGSQIAYDADGDGDGWQELWVMNADGSNQRQVYDPTGAQTDIWARSWSPDGRYVAFTQITLVQYQGRWYWDTAYLYAWDSQTGGLVALNGRDTEWYPDWQTADIAPPVSTFTPLPVESPSPFVVSWGGADVGLAGIRSYDVQVKDGMDGVWTDWMVGVTNMSAAYSGSGGHSYYFRVRASDNAGNLEAWPAEYDGVTTVEAMPPISALKALPAYSRNGFTLTWQGKDFGGSGVNRYEIQYHLAGSEWGAFFQSDTTSRVFDGTPGQTYYFRVRAIDNANNVEPWPVNDSAEVSTTLYVWKLSGAVYNHIGVPVTDLNIKTAAETVKVIPGDAFGNYALYLGYTAQSNVIWQKRGYGDSAAFEFNNALGDDIKMDVVLPPADNLIRDWGFEAGDWGPASWLPAGSISPTLTDEFEHTGKYAALLGNWGAITQLGEAHRLDIGVDAGGVAHIVWFASGVDGAGDVFYAQRDSYGTWTKPQNVSNNSDNSWDPQLSVEADGTVNLIWHEDGDSVTRLIYARRHRNGVWSTPQVLSDSGYVNLPYIHTDANGVTHVAWRTWDPGTETIFYRQRTPQGGWSAPEAVMQTHDNMLTIRDMTVDSNGNVHLFSTYHYVYRNSEGVWSTPQATGMTVLKVAADDMGVVHVVSLRSVNNIDGYSYAQRSSEGIWSTPVPISGPGYANGVQLAMGHDGRVHIVWCEANPDGSVAYVLYRSCRAGAVCSASQIISQDEWTTSPQIAVDAAGAVHVVWGSSRSGTEGLHYRGLNTDNVWSAPKYFRGVSLDYYASVRLAAGAPGEIHVVFRSNMSETPAYYLGPVRGRETGDFQLQQSVTLPLSMTAPALSFLYQLHTQSTIHNSWFGVDLNDGTGTTTVFSSTEESPDWTHRWIDLSDWVGRSVTLTFSLHQATNVFPTRVYLDEVSLGSTAPDLWVNKSSSATKSGATLVYHITYGNRGGAPADGVRIADFLPADVVYVDAAPQPAVETGMLPARIWDAGTLPANSGPFTIVVTATVPLTVPAFSTLTNTVSITATTPELELANNTAVAASFVGYQAYLPLVMRQ